MSGDLWARGYATIIETKIGKNFVIERRLVGKGARVSMLNVLARTYMDW